MKKLTINGNILSQQIYIRRMIYYLSIFAISSYILAGALIYFHEGFVDIFDSSPSVPEYNRFIDQKGDFRPYFGYEILQFVVNPLPDKFTELTNYLDEQDELSQYFTFVPKSDYHITLTKLKDRGYFNKVSLNILTNEQVLLDRDYTNSFGYGNEILLIDKQEIRLHVELATDFVVESVTKLQSRWSRDFSKLVDQHYISYHITLAYQYKDIPNKDTFNRLKKVLNDWRQFPVDVHLGAIKICSYRNIVSHTSIL